MRQWFYDPRRILWQGCSDLVAGRPGPHRDIKVSEFTIDVERRVKQHFDGEGAVWTKKYKPIRLLETFVNVSLEIEDEITEEYMRKFGWKNVRGGNFVFTEMDYKETPEHIHQRKKDGAYLLQLTGNKYYVGFSTNIEDDITRQFNGRGCEWTKLYRPIKVLKAVKSLNRQTQMNMTLAAMKDLGWENVRGIGGLILLSISLRN